MGFTNSDSTNPITPIVVRTRDSAASIIDSGESDRIVFVANKISEIIARATECGGSGVSTTEALCTFQLKFNIGAEYPIEAGSIVEIELPEDLSIPDPAVTTAPGASSTEGIADLSAKFTVSGRTVTVNDAFVQASTPNGLNWQQDSFSIFIAGIKTTRSTKPTLSFKARIMDSNRFVQYERKQGVYSNVE